MVATHRNHVSACVLRPGTERGGCPKKSRGGGERGSKGALAGRVPPEKGEQKTISVCVRTTKQSEAR